MKITYWTVGIIALVVVLAGGFWYVQSQKSEESKVIVTPVPNAQQEEATGSSATLDTSVKVSVKTITLKSVGEYSGSGIATRVFADGTFTHTVTANVDDPADGKFYEGWFVNMSLTPPFFSTGKLVRDSNGYKLAYSTNQDYSNYTKVIITEESASNGLDGVPEAHVLEGSF